MRRSILLLALLLFPVAAGAAGKRHVSGTVQPSTCSVGDVFHHAGAANPDCVCEPVDTWSCSADPAGVYEPLLVNSAGLAAALSDETGTGLACFNTDTVIATPDITGKVDRNSVAVDDDDCTGEQGMAWYDTTDERFEWCDENSGVPHFLHPRNVIPTAIDSPAGGGGTNYYGGHYRFGGSANDFNPPINFGTANAAYADHAFVVCAAGGGGGTDTVVQVAGTSITDEMVRTTSDTQDLTIDDAGAAGAYYETSKKWIGQISLTKISGPDLLCNYGATKYQDAFNTNFTVTGFEVNWLAGSNDSGLDILLRHHKTAGWTYSAGSEPIPPTAIVSLQDIYVVEYEASNGESGAFKEVGLSVDVEGDDGEGVFWEVVTTSAGTIEVGMALVIIEAR